MSAPLSLYELNNLVRSAFDTVLYDRYWVKAELGEVQQNRGHCFLEFVQKDEKSNALVAKARGQIWANTWAILRPYFENSTKRQLASGMQVLVCVELTFHEVYGYSLNVTDIDPTYTLGDIARKRQDIIRSLEKAGIAEMNKDLELPRLLQRIAVISSASAAGYGDFIKQLEGNNKCLKFEVKLFAATMQGDGVESSVIKALDCIAKEMDDWDAVVIIRGGGAASDLYGFDTLALGENIAQFPLPVISGIGHERDDTIVDIVAHTRVKTPTAAADFIIRHQEAELNILHEFSERISRECTSLISKEKI
ncbi:MAG: exodeoxyribonuclease VII large subunit, partial [Bacteroidaceae bacterium]|nr:exodeoxyribonuclease VII large subunit [Bacteroidaceae bacterium]